MGGLLGLDYPGAEAALRMTTPRADRPRLFRDLQVMERAVLAAMAERKQPA